MAALAGRGVAVACAFTLLVLTGWSFVQLPSPKATQPLPRAGRHATPTAWQTSTVEQKSDTQAVEVPSWSEALRVVLAITAAFLVAVLPMEGAEAARSGGRMGGMGGGMRMGGMRSRSAPRPPPRSQPQAGPRFSTGPNISIGVGPVIAPPMFGPPIFGPPMGLFGPPVLPLPVPSMGPSASDQIMQDQQRRDERQLDSQKTEIEALQKELADLKAKRQ